MIGIDTLSVLSLNRSGHLRWVADFDMLRMSLFFSNLVALQSLVSTNSISMEVSHAA